MAAEIPARPLAYVRLFDLRAEDLDLGEAGEEAAEVVLERLAQATLVR